LAFISLIGWHLPCRRCRGLRLALDADSDSDSDSLWLWLCIFLGSRRRPY